MKFRPHTIVATLFLPFVLAPAGLAQSPDELQASLLTKIILFTEWPEEALPPESPLRIGVVGDESFLRALEDEISDRTIKDRPVDMSEVGPEDELGAFHVLFVGSSGSELSEVLERVRASAVLTVGEGSDFLSKGGMVRFSIESRKVRFEIAPSRVREAELSMSPRLLELAVRRRQD